MMPIPAVPRDSGAERCGGKDKHKTVLRQHTEKRKTEKSSPRTASSWCADITARIDSASKHTMVRSRSLSHRDAREVQPGAAPAKAAVSKQSQ